MTTVTNINGRTIQSNLSILELENGFLVDAYDWAADKQNVYVFESLDGLITWMKENIKTKAEMRSRRA